MDGVDGVDAVVAGGDEVGADAAEPAEGEGAVPVAGHFLVQFRTLEGLLGTVIRSQCRVHQLTV